MPPKFGITEAARRRLRDGLGPTEALQAALALFPNSFQRQFNLWDRRVSRALREVQNAVAHSDLSWMDTVNRYLAEPAPWLNTVEELGEELHAALMNHQLVEVSATEDHGDSDAATVADLHLLFSRPPLMEPEVEPEVELQTQEVLEVVLITGRSGDPSVWAPPNRPALDVTQLAPNLDWCSVCQVANHPSWSLMQTHMLLIGDDAAYHGQRTTASTFVCADGRRVSPTVAALIGHWLAQQRGWKISHVNLEELTEESAPEFQQRQCAVCGWIIVVPSSRC